MLNTSSPGGVFAESVYVTGNGTHGERLQFRTGEGSLESDNSSLINSTLVGEQRLFSDPD